MQATRDNLTVTDESRNFAEGVVGGFPSLIVALLIIYKTFFEYHVINELHEIVGLIFTKISQSESK